LLTGHTEVTETPHNLSLINTAMVRHSQRDAAGFYGNALNYWTCFSIEGNGVLREEAVTCVTSTGVLVYL